MRDLKKSRRIPERVHVRRERPLDNLCREGLRAPYPNPEADRAGECGIAAFRRAGKSEGTTGGAGQAEWVELSES